MHRFRCIHCNQSLVDNGSLAGQTVPCPRCKKSIEVPRREVPAPTIEAREAAGESFGVPEITHSHASELSQRTRWHHRAPLQILISSALVAFSLLVLSLAILQRSSDQPLSVAYNSPMQSSEASTADLDRDADETPVPHSVRRPNPEAPESSVLGVTDGGSILEEPSEDLHDDAEPAPRIEGLTAEELYERVALAVVQIEVRGRDARPIATGSGFFADPHGLVVTNAHVALADGAAFLLVRLLDDTTYFVDAVQAFDRKWDLAVLQVCGQSPCHIAVASSPPKVGAKVFTVGNPSSLRHTFSEGIVSGIRPVGNGHSIVQTTAAIGGGSSGGPLLTDRAEVVGAVTLMITTGQNLNFAVPASAIQELLASSSPPSKIVEASRESDESVPPVGSATSSVPVVTTPQQSLANLPGVRVVVENLHASSRVAGLSERDTEAGVIARLNGLGIPVLSPEQAVSHPRFPTLYVRISTIANHDYSTYGYIVELSLQQHVALLIPNNEVVFFNLATTWSTPGIYGSIGRHRLLSTVAASLAQMIDRFADDYRAMNAR